MISETPSRRFFLETAGLATTAAFLTGAPFVRSADKAGLKTPVLGSGDHTYEAIHD